jgi:hypothetical protein
MRDAIVVARRMGIISRSAQRDRRPALGELDRLLAHFVERRKKAPQALPMHKVWTIPGLPEGDLFND